MKEYTIARVDDRVPLDDGVEETPWAAGEEFRVDEFCWYESGPKPDTRGRAVYDEDALYLRFEVEDESISAAVTELNGPTFEDSSVEFFADPTPEADSKYLNFEPNCCGQFKLGWQEKGWQERGIDRDLVSEALAAEIEVRTSVSGPTRDPSTDDEGWWLAARLPFDALSSFTDADIAPTDGTEWRGNFYRSGVATPSQKSTWNPVETPEPRYHSPEFFGRLVFG